MKDAEAEEEVGEERISVSLLRETSGLSRVRAPTPIVISEEIFKDQQEITRGIWARQLVSPQPKLGPVP